MAAGASVLDTRYGGRHGCNSTRFGGMVNGNQGGRAAWGTAAALLGNKAVVIDDEDYEIEKGKEAFEDDPALLAVPKDRKRERETERQEFRQERKQMRKGLQAKERDVEKPEKKLELNPLLKVRSKDGTAAVDTDTGGDSTATAKTPADVDTPAKVQEAEDRRPAKAEEPTKSGSVAATEAIPKPTAIGSLLGYASEDESSDDDEPSQLPSYNFLNLKEQVKAPPKAVPPVSKTIEVAASPGKNSPQRKFPLPKSRSPATAEFSELSAEVTHSKNTARAERRFPLPRARSQTENDDVSAATSEEPWWRQAIFGSGTPMDSQSSATQAQEDDLEKASNDEFEMDTSMKEVSPALAALMSGLDD